MSKAEIFYFIEQIAGVGIDLEKPQKRKSFNKLMEKLKKEVEETKDPKLVEKFLKDINK